MTNLERWHYYCKDYQSPDIFITWTFYAMISAAMQRRVWIGESGRKDIYANQFIIFIGPPSSGKTLSADDAKRLFKSFDGLDEKHRPKSLIKMGPSSVTLEALTRYLNLNYVTVPWPDGCGKPKGSIYTSSPLAFFCGNELGSLIREQTNDLVVFLNEGWECGDFHRETKTQGVDHIKNMCITLLGAATPEWMQQVMNSRLLGEGFTARVIFVFADQKRDSPYFISYTEDQVAKYNEIRLHIEKLSKVFGEVIISDEVRGFLEDWLRKHKPINDSKKLDAYYGRKKLHVAKLAMAIHFSDRTDLCITIEDCQKAIALLAETEQEMHKALVGAGKNPIAVLASAIEHYLEKRNEFVSQKEIMMDFFDNGDAEQIKAALQFLVETTKVSAHNEKGVIGYLKIKK